MAQAKELQKIGIEVKVVSDEEAEKATASKYTEEEIEEAKRHLEWEIEHFAEIDIETAIREQKGEYYKYTDADGQTVYVACVEDSIGQYALNISKGKKVNPDGFPSNVYSRREYEEGGVIGLLKDKYGKLKFDDNGNLTLELPFKLEKATYEEATGYDSPLARAKAETEKRRNDLTRQFNKKYGAGRLHGSFI